MQRKGIGIICSYFANRHLKRHVDHLEAGGRIVLLIMNKDLQTINLHALRGVASVFVLVFHAKFIMWCGGQEWLKVHGFQSAVDYVLFAVDMLLSAGHQWVIVFFMLSGFVISHSNNENKYSIKNYLAIRFIRLYLPYIASVAYGILVLLVCVRYVNPDILQVMGREYNERLAVANDNITLPSFFSTLYFVPRPEYMGLNFAYWSLLHESIFYLLFPLYRVTGQWRPAVLCLVIVLAATTHTDLIYYQMYFLMGMLVYDHRFRKLPIISGVKFSMAATVVLYLGIIAFLKYFNNSVAADLCGALMTYFLMTALLRSKKMDQRWYRVGDVSYTLYLFHLPTLLLIYTFYTVVTNEYVIIDRIYYYLSTLVCFALAFPAFRIMEEPSLRLIKKYKQLVFAPASEKLSSPNR
ncbi:MAG TPA: acyltransferase [Chitinophagales bacterium]|nr:acyltransferase [Chitinophagales bacterium]